ncbi:hypothetical protein BT96DRAFT_313050 [Gymnopus androsaceus JB14]|uniref:Uncharacterized protein n=1 Tax=Gymnopus androsaceus JB14 TaxID=1447944 RepID=A0A6A4IA37_9AGAR|nr:hypothetical protein BT96DRAFT_313050 [Gymnopus androsaceus JB14]
MINLHDSLSIQAFHVRLFVSIVLIVPIVVPESYWSYRSPQNLLICPPAYARKHYSCRLYKSCYILCFSSLQ